jgi:hypothetical protein
VHVGGPRATGGGGRSHDVQDAVAQAAVVAGDHVLHVARRRNVRGGRAQRGVRGREVDHRRVTDDDADERLTLPLEGPELERRCRFLRERCVSERN